MKELDIMPWMENNGIGKDDNERNDILKDVHTAISKLVNEKGEKISKEDYFIAKND